MARRRYRRYYKRKSGKWSANIQDVGQNITFPSGDSQYTTTIMSNPSQQPSYITQTYTVKNIEATFTFDDESFTPQAGRFLEGITAYIMFVPQGYGQLVDDQLVLPNDYHLQHPEYIMAYKFIGSPSNELIYNQNINQTVGQQYQPIRIRTRLARKLQSGDSVVLYIHALNQNESSVTIRMNGLLRWWTKAN